MVHRRVKGGKFKIKHVEKQCPVELGEELLVNITDVAPSGDGISKIRGCDIIVPKAKPRDCVRIRITQVSKEAAVGEIIN